MKQTTDRKKKPTPPAASAPLYERALVELCKINGLPLPTAEYQFHPTRKWRFDYYLERDTTKVALELEGGIYTRGRHTRPSGFLGDMDKYNAAAEMGILLVRAKSTPLPQAATIETLKKIFQ